MKKLLLLSLAMFVAFSAFSQTEEEKAVFDYKQTKHELAVEIPPIFGGAYPYSLFYRKNYTGQNGKAMGFRANLHFRNEFRDNLSFFQNTAYNKSNFLNYGIEIGLERQRKLSEKFIGYGGIDGGFFYTNSRFKELTQMFEGNDAFVNVDDFSFSLTKFWGMKYHINSRFSISAETGFQGRYSTSVTRSATDRFGEVQEQKGESSFSFNLVPLRALRVAYHF
ncbi:hypothetical protein [Fontibacter flavus]|uniref:Outer membrane protein beta-barrel domain-containing protein n=1 Tax=Fontibacter flavus TaxID=654838 RepID=A0ABV6FY55_9BACT